MKTFQIEISQLAIDDLKTRLKNTRWPDEVSGSNWSYGVNRDYLKEVISYWLNDFDWREQEAKLNEFPHFLTEIDGLKVHFIYIKSKKTDSTPLLLLHGWPGSFVQMLKIAPLLSSSFDIVIPSLVGFGFSQASTQPGMSVGSMAEIFHTLMTETLGYKKYGVRGGDLGAGVLAQLALVHGESIIGTHQGGTTPWVDFEHLPQNLTAAETEFIVDAKKWNNEEMAYALLHASKPQTLAYALNDSPVGLAAWILEKFRRWSDCDGDLEKRFSKDELLTNISIYWFTETINSSMRLYYETMRNPGVWGQSTVPNAMLMSSKDMFATPQEWVERQGKPARYTAIDRGGHFLEWEEPEIVANDISIFFNGLS